MTSPPPSSFRFDGITSLSQVYDNWSTDSKIYLRNYRKCDFKWIALALHTCKYTKKYKILDDKYQQETMDIWVNDINSKWLHRDPILRMSLAQIFDSLNGLVYHIFCGLYDTKYMIDQDGDWMNWLRCVRHTLDLIRYRCYLLSCHEFSTNMLDLEEYVLNSVEMEEFSRVGVLDDTAYYSDDEKKKEVKKLKLAESVVIDIYRLFDAASIMNDNDSDDKNIEKTWTNRNFVFDINTMFHYVDTRLDVFEKEWLPLWLRQSKDLNEKFDLHVIRQHANMKLMEGEMIGTTRKEWQSELCMLPCHKELYMRKTTRERFKWSEIMGLFVGKKVKNEFPGTKREMFLPPALFRTESWLRVSTDFFFKSLSLNLTEGDIYQCLVTTEEENDKPVTTIFRVRVLERWMLIHQGEKIGFFDSFTRAFIMLRRRMIELGESPFVPNYYMIRMNRTLYLDNVQEVFYELPPPDSMVNLSQFDFLFVSSLPKT